MATELGVTVRARIAGPASRGDRISLYARADRVLAYPAADRDELASIAEQAA